MKRRILNLLVIFSTLLMQVFTAAGVTPAYAATAFTPIFPPSPSGITGNNWSGIWGLGANDIYVMGNGTDSSNNGFLLMDHYDGSNWTSTILDLPSGWQNGYLAAAWGSSANDIYAVGDGQDGSGNNMPLMYHYDGSSWTASTPALPSGGNDSYLNAVWGSAANNIYAVGFGYDSFYNKMLLMYHYDGSSWVAIPPALPSGWQTGSFYGAWGSAANDIYVVGGGQDGSGNNMPLMYHYDGSNWVAIPPALPSGLQRGFLNGAWGSAANDVYAVGWGYNGTMKTPLMYHYDGNYWAQVAVPSVWDWSSLTSVWGSGANDVYAVGDGNTSDSPLVYHYDGGSWTNSTPALPSSWLSGALRGVWGSGAGNIYAVGYGYGGSGAQMPLMYHGIPASYTVQFHANGGAGTMAEQSADTSTALTANTFTRTGFTFAGWSTTPTGAVEYSDGATYNFAADIDLYAKWKTAYTGPIFYVKSGGMNDCSSWGDACDLQIALAGADDGDQIWVAAGMYNPITPVDLNNVTNTERQAAFRLVSGVAVYGGFYGDEAALADRHGGDSILSGDIDNNDINDDGNIIAETYTDIQGNNSYHVVIGAENATLDGFVVTAGHANGDYDLGFQNGAGMRNSSSPQILNNVVFSGNWASSSGGGMYNADVTSSLKLTNVTFNGNYAYDGGGMYNVKYSSPTLDSVTFSNNSASHGGGMYNTSGSAPSLTNVTFSGNQAGLGGGLGNLNSNPTLTNVTFSGNHSYNYGGGLYNENSSPNIVNSIFWGNTADLGDAQIRNYASAPVVTYSIVQDGYTDGDGHVSITDDPMLGALDYYGGLTKLFALLAGSSAINAGDDSVCPEIDQRGVTRAGNGAACDIGAYEYENPADDFVITVQTDNDTYGRGSSDVQFRIPTYSGATYNYNVDCNNDGINEATAQTGNYTCNYAAAGTYTVRIKDNNGDGTGFPQIFFNDDGDARKLIDIEQWGTGKWASMNSAFKGCLNLMWGQQATDTPNLSGVTNMSYMFADSHFDQNIGNWDTSHVTDMSYMFFGDSPFDQNIGNWDTSHVTDMTYMFSGAYAFDHDISKWNVGALTRANYMFVSAGLSTANYDALLKGWGAQNLQPNVEFNGGYSQYCSGAAARANMISAKGWVISDGGASCFTVHYDANNATSGTAPADQTKTYIMSLALAANTGNLARTGYTFNGWNTQADGNGTHFDVGSNYTDNAALTLYAEWKVGTYTVTYNANNATSGTAPANQTKTYGVDLTLAANTGNLARSGYTFNGWNTQADGTGTHYASGATYTANTGVTLYAEWKENTYTVTFDAQGGTPTPPDQTVAYGNNVTQPTNPSKAGSAFTGWYNGNIAWDFVNDTVSSNLTLTAHWTITSTQTMQFRSNAANDGMVRESSETSGIGGYVDPANQMIAVGDDNLKRQYMGVLDFDTSDLPDNAVITNVQLRVKVMFLSSDVYSKLGNLTADITKPYFANSLTLQNADFQARARAANIGNFTRATDINQWITLRVSASSLSALNLLGHTQFRLHFTLTNSNDAIAHRIAFLSGDNRVVADQPLLIITYFVP
jgi:uncharacterized repeat protein (TIGR02543 family)